MSLTGEKSLRTRLLNFIHTHKIKQVEVAREAVVHHSTLSLFLQGKIQPNAKTEQNLEQWLERGHLSTPGFPRVGLGKPIETAETKAASQKQQEVKKMIPEDAMKVEEDLVPVRIDLEYEGIRLRENIIWNAGDKLITPEFFAKQVAADNDLPPYFENEIISLIQKAVFAHRKYVPTQPELIKVIELDLRVENVCIKDRFEWDINDPNNVPEEFAIQLCNELGLTNEFMVLIAHSIREQIEGFRREIIEMGGESFANMKKSMRSLIESGQKFVNSSLQKNLQSRVVTEDNYIRSVPVAHNEEDGLALWGPKIEVIDPEDIEKFEKLENRKLRYEKRRR